MTDEDVIPEPEKRDPYYEVEIRPDGAWSVRYDDGSGVLPESGQGIAADTDEARVQAEGWIRADALRREEQRKFEAATERYEIDAADVTKEALKDAAEQAKVERERLREQEKARKAYEREQAKLAKDIEKGRVPQPGGGDLREAEQ